MNASMGKYMIMANRWNKPQNLGAWGLPPEGSRFSGESISTAIKAKMPDVRPGFTPAL